MKHTLRAGACDLGTTPPLGAPVFIALTLLKAGGLQLSRVHLIKSTFDLMSPVMPTFMASQVSEVTGDEGRLGVCEMLPVSVTAGTRTAPQSRLRHPP